MGGAGAGSSSGKGKDAWEAVSIMLRIATVGMSLASAVMTFASTRCVFQDNGSPAGSVSYSDYGSFKYSALANVVSAFLQGVAIWLEVLGKDKWSKTVELIDKLVLALTSTSGPLLLAADDITSCGPPRGRGRSNNGARRQPKLFEGRLQQLAAPLSLGSLLPAAANEVVKQKLKQYEEVRSADLAPEQDDGNSLVLVLPSAAVPPAPVPPPPPSPPPPPPPPVIVLPPPPPPPPPPRPPMVLLPWRRDVTPPQPRDPCTIM